MSIVDTFAIHVRSLRGVNFAYLQTRDIVPRQLHDMCPLLQPI